MPFFFETQADFGLSRANVLGFPVKIVHFLNWAEMIFGRTVAFQTPAHAVRLIMVDHFHLIHIAVAALTAHAAIHVDRVVEIHVIRGLMDPHPWDRLTRFIAVAHDLQLGTCLRDL